MSEPPSALRDRYGRGLREVRISVTDRCNFRCNYCMPSDVSYRHAPRAAVLSFEEIRRVAAILVDRFGVSKLRLTGGEPLTRSDLPQLVRMLSGLSGVTDLALTTNGSLLEGAAVALRDAGLMRLTVSLDALDPQTFTRLTGGRGDVRRVLRGLDAAEKAGFESIKLNCVVQRGVNEHAVGQLVRHFARRPVVVRFIEYMDVGTLNDWQAGGVFSATEIAAELEKLAPVRPLPRAHRSEVAERFALERFGEVGIIASVTRAFCRDCTRARLSAEGTLLSCLFASQGLDLRGPMRGGEADHELAARIEGAWRARADRYSEARAERSAKTGARRRLEMYQMGG